MSKQSKEFNHAYNSGYWAGMAEARSKVEQDSSDLDAFCIAELGLILSRKEGYVRIGCDAAGAIWARFKWSAGTHSGSYTFGSGPSLCEAITQMCGRVVEVEQGKRRPTPDTGYKRR